MLPQYEIIHLIASGGMGAVYRGVQKALDRPVAIKILPPEAARDSEAIGRFRTEARAMAKLTHPNIPAVYEFDVANGYCYFAMEFVEGNNVFQLIRQGRLPPERALDIFRQVCDALHFAHARGITHGDIKPANILVNPEGVVKLADFGLAQLMDNSGRERWEPMGTPEYAAPELFVKDAVVGPAADIYSLGPVLYEMLTGAPPQGHFELPARALKLDLGVDTIISTCMRPEPSARYPSAAAARDAAEAILRRMRERPREAPVKIVRPPTPQRKASRTSKTKGTGRRSRARKSGGVVFYLFVILVTAAAVGAILYFLRNLPPPSQAPSRDIPAESSFIRPNPKPSTKSPEPASSTPSSDSRPPSKESPSTSQANPSPGRAISPALREALDGLLAKYREIWRNDVETPRRNGLNLIRDRHLQALARLDSEYQAKNDPASLLRVRAERDRVNTIALFSLIPEERISPDEKLGALQKALNAELQQAKEAFTSSAAGVKKRYLEALKALEAGGRAKTSADREAVAAALASVPEEAEELEKFFGGK